MAVTLLDIAKKNGSDAAVGLVDECSKTNVEITGLDTSSGRQIPNVATARTINGQFYKTYVRTALGNAGGSFRDANQGTASIKHTYENRLVETYISEPRWKADCAVAERSEDGAEKYIADEAQGIVEGEMQAWCRMFYYGRNAAFGHAKAFPGLLQCYDAVNMLVDATGTTAATGSSVWAVKFGEKFVQWVMGENGRFQLNKLRRETLKDADGNEYDGYVQTMLSYPGLQVATKTAVARIKNLTEDANKGLTNALLSKLMEKFPLRVKPDVIFMSQRSQRQLRDSRTATTATGAEAPLPQDYDGIPIVPTDALLNIETIDLA